MSPGQLNSGASTRRRLWASVLVLMVWNVDPTGKTGRETQGRAAPGGLDA
jgi:hypothetical protein